MRRPPEVLCCQVCGRVIPNRTPYSEDWLVSQHRDGSGTWIVRCPAHVSEWALRNSYAGRDKRMRELARRGKEKPVPLMIGLEPMPATARGAGAEERREDDGKQTAH